MPCRCRMVFSEYAVTFGQAQQNTAADQSAPLGCERALLSIHIRVCLSACLSDGRADIANMHARTHLSLERRRKEGRLM